MSLRLSRGLTLGLLLLAPFAVSCAKSSELRGRVAGLHEVADEAEKNGALRCAPRELALTRAYTEFAELELDKGSTSHAEAFVVRAELNARAATLQTPAEFCGNTAPPKPVPVLGDADGDGFLDPLDQCPKEAEVFNMLEDGDGCPDDPDTDGDGFRDSVDACRLEAEDTDKYLDDDGCPEPDNDLDLVLDSADKCPLEGEDPDGYEDADGCPELDNDHDQVPDLTDACPSTPGDKDGDGCPKKAALVVVTDCEVKITQQIHFANAKAVIQKESFPVLDAVVDVVQKNSSIHLEVQGHTDDKGSDAYNKKLSHARAESVRKYLIAKGVSVDRLVFNGYGEERPLVPNDSADNRSLNRRVQFMRTEGVKAECAQTPAERGSEK